MNGYLLDTNVISEYNREETPHPASSNGLRRPPRPHSI
jgi:hypothetical protein